MADETVFGKAAAEFYDKLFAMTDSLVAACAEPSPTLFATTANMVCEAAEDAIKRFRAENQHPLG